MTPHAEALGDWRAGDGSGLAERLADALETALLDGRLPFAALPSERALAAAVGVSRATVTEAYGTLRRRGWLQTRRGARAVPVLPRTIRDGLAPRDGGRGGGETIDLTLAAPAGPAGAYLEALERAYGRVGAQLATTGLTGPGLPELRARVADRYTAAGLPTVAEEIVITCGAMAGLHLVASALLAPRAPAITELPSFPTAIDLLRASGRRVAGWPVRSGWDAELLDALIRRRGARAAYVIADFHNPTGRVASPAERAAVVGVAREHGLLVVDDHTMRELDLRTEPAGEPPLAALWGDVVCVGSLSKLLWTGLRVGWVRAPRAVAARLSGHPLMAALAAAPLEQLVALELLGELDTLGARRRRALRARLDHLLGALADLDGIEATRPCGGLSVWTSLRTSSSALVERAARAGVRVAPGGRFSPDAPLDRHLRIPFALPEPVLDEALRRLAPLL